MSAELTSAPSSVESPPSALAVLRALQFPLALFVFSRVAIVAVNWIGLTLDTRLHRRGNPFELPGVQALCWWDCGWYVGIADNGYQQLVSANFFPLLPLLGAAVHRATGLATPLSVILIANLAALGAYIFVYKIFRELEDEATARNGTALLAAFPFAFFHAAGYPESLMVFFTALAIWLGLRAKHLSAGLALGLGIVARHLSVMAGLSLALLHVQQRGLAPKRLLFHRAFLGLLVPFLFPAAFFFHLSRRFGDPNTWWHARTRGWGEQAWAGIPEWLARDWPPEVDLYVGFSLIPAVGALLLLSRRRWWPLAPFGLGLMIVLWSVGIMGLGRYSASCWPAFLPLGALLARRPAFAIPVLCGLAMVQGMFLFLYGHSHPIS